MGYLYLLDVENVLAQAKSLFASISITAVRHTTYIISSLYKSDVRYEHSCGSSGRRCSLESMRSVLFVMTLVTEQLAFVFGTSARLQSPLTRHFNNITI